MVNKATNPDEFPMLSDYSDLAGIDHRNPEPITDLAPGDEVTVGISKSPVWKVIAVHDGKAWMYRVDTPWVDGVGRVERLRRVAQVIQLGAVA